MNTAEHVQWARDRALEYADAGDIPAAISSLTSDLAKHPDTAHNNVGPVMTALASLGYFDEPGSLRAFIIARMVLPPVIAACRPVDLARMPPVPPGLPTPYVYPGSVKGRCRRCRLEVWIGPKVQEEEGRDPNLQVLCFACAISVSAEHGFDLTDLGNTFQPRPR